MFIRKNWLPVSVFLIAIIGVGLYLLTTQTPKAPVKIYKSVEVQQPTTLKPPPPGETYETGHWHGDEWHAEPHDTLPLIAEEIPVGFEAVVDPDLADFTDEELATYERVRFNEVSRHQQKYPDCQDHEAVWEDAARNAKWYIGYKKWQAKEAAAYEAWKEVMFENDELYENLRFNMSEAERHEYLRNMPDAERAALGARLETWKQRKDAASQRHDEVNQEEPIEPKRLHTH